MLISAAAAVAFAGIFAAFTVSGAYAHQNGCHAQHSCPSDHHTYIWYDSNGQGWDCVQRGAPEYNPSLDTTTIDYAGLTYFCRAAASTATTTSPLPTTTVETTPTLPVTTTAPATTAPLTTTTTVTTTATTTSALPPGAPRPPTGSGMGLKASATPGKTVRLRARVKTSGCRLGPNPDRRCSPGAYYANLSKAVLCSPSFHTSSIRNVPESEKHAVEVEYGMPPRSYGRNFEIDPIVSLELGGSNDIANLYPEKAPGYHIKDRLENKLHSLVCSSAMTLRAAQVGIATNWQALYKQVFGIAPGV